MDRQHPRDLFDVWQLFEIGGFTDRMVECFVIYLPGHNRPTHEVLFGNDKNIAGDYNSSFVGMPETECPLATLLETRLRLRNELPARLTKSHRNFLAGLAHSEPGSSCCNTLMPMSCLRSDGRLLTLKFSAITARKISRHRRALLSSGFPCMTKQSCKGEVTRTCVRQSKGLAITSPLTVAGDSALR